MLLAFDHSFLESGGNLMGRQARGEFMDPSEVQIFHCVHRCVRRAFLCGKDPYSGKCFEHRRVWIRNRLEFLASIFAIDCLTYTVMSNHLHQILRSRPDVAKAWSDQEVARRWLKLFPPRRIGNDSSAEPSREDLTSITNDPERVAELRRRLSDISWWARCTAENIARLSNREDEVTGHFWEGRYKSQPLPDESAVLACAAYVDLNPVRAALAKTPESSKFTGASDRIKDLRKRNRQKRMSDRRWERSGDCSASGWMSPIEVDPSKAPSNASGDARSGTNHGATGRRASDKGFLSISLSGYLELLDWTGRQIRAAVRGSIPKHLAPILQRLGLSSSRFGAAEWCDLVENFRLRVRRTSRALQPSGS